MTDKQLDLLSVPAWKLARRYDPDTSHEAAASIDIAAQALKVLKAYETSNVALLDIEAYKLAGLLNGLRSGIGARCADLRKKGLIERTGEKSKTPSGRLGHLCRITDAGRKMVKDRI